MYLPQACNSIIYSVNNGKQKNLCAKFSEVPEIKV